MNCKECKNGNLHDFLMECHSKYSNSHDVAREFWIECRKRGDTRGLIDIVFDMMNRGCIVCSNRKEKPITIYNETTIIGDEEITLSPKEREWAGNFNRSRVAFAILKDGKCAINVKDEREHRIYLQEDFGISKEEVGLLIRGYIKPGRIVFYRSFEYLPIEKITRELLQTISECAETYFGAGEYEVWNGVHIGNIGEEWGPIEKLPNITITASYKIPPIRNDKYQRTKRQRLDKHPFNLTTNKNIE